MIDIKAIREAAEAAPQDVWRYEPIGQAVCAGKTYMVAAIRGGHLKYLPNGEALQDATGIHIATANPSTVLVLCDEIERLRTDAARYQWLRDQNADPNANFYVGCEEDGMEVGDITWVGCELDGAVDAAMEAK